MNDIIIYNVLFVNLFNCIAFMYNYYDSNIYPVPFLIVDVCDDISDTVVSSTSWDDVSTAHGDESVS